MRDLGTTMVNSYARSINESGVVVGEMTDASQLNDRAFVYTAGQLHDLNDLAALPAGWTLREAEEVNDLGQIVGWATNAQGRHSAFLLTPVPDPAAVALLPAALALLSLRRGRGGRRMTKRQSAGAPRAAPELMLSRGALTPRHVA
jgi:probable HAF family extracellular repeat protein